jgi:hypothetical protein
VDDIFTFWEIITAMSSRDSEKKFKSFTEQDGSVSGFWEDAPMH